ncbi:hypothetical protein [Rhodococcus sp. JVH1]|uniref:hypothetical protein n=1 Tax=Rhodococcus sp. JVH1 TaxID=745408 RepID=UPI0005C26270
MKVSPTRIEVIGPRPRTEPGDHLEERMSAQLPRPVRTHATVFAGDVESVITNLERRGVRHRVSPAGNDFPSPRVWIGVTDDDPLGYDPTVDGGLLAEVISPDLAGLPTEYADPADFDSYAPGTIVRVAARRFLVADLDEAVRALDANLLLTPSGLVTDTVARRARYTFGIGASAGIELAQPTSADSDLADFAGKWGPGPHAVVLAVRGLEQFALDLEVRGTPFTRSENHEGQWVLHVDTSFTSGTPFEFQEIEPSPK